MADRKFTDRAPRLPLDVQVNCDGTHIAYSKNISESGLAFIIDGELEISKMIQLKFNLPGSTEELDAIGKVVRCESVSENFFECGISFWDISEEASEALQEFFKKSRA